MRDHPKAIGDRSEAHVLAALVDVHHDVLIPWGENSRYDLVIDTGTDFVRVQCKTGRLRDGAVRFSACSTTYHHPNNRGTRVSKHHYREQVDVFGVYCPETRGVYLVPVEDVGTNLAALRVSAPRNAQRARIRWAKDYVVCAPE